MLIATLVDWKALGQVVAYSFAGALLMVVLFTAGVVALAGHGEGAAVPAAQKVAGGVALLCCVALLVFGISVLFDK